MDLFMISICGFVSIFFGGDSCFLIIRNLKGKLLYLYGDSRRKQSGFGKCVMRVFAVGETGKIC